MNVFTDLLRRQGKLGRPLNVAVVGAGFLGGGLVHALSRIQGMRPALVANRTPERAESVLRAAGADPARIVRCDDPDAAERAIAAGQWVVTRDVELFAGVPSIDAVMEATGTMQVGTDVALAGFRARKHVIEANPEVQVTLGACLKPLADEAGVVYSDIDGDQPGIIMNLHGYCRGLGLEPVVAGNCKGVMKRYATPSTQAAFAAAAGISPWIATAAADGTKLNLEMALVANATGMRPARTGMAGVETGLEALLESFSRHGLLEAGPIVEYTLGIPSGVFVIARSGDPHLRKELRYLKMGDGPEYLFYRPYVLCAFEAPLTAAEAVLYGTATAAPAGDPVADVATFAKRDLRAGEPLEGIGGAKHYGLIMAVEALREENALPVGLAEYATVARDVLRDGLIRYDDVVLDEAPIAVRLRREVEECFRARSHAR
ncbi:MAG: NAD(P)-dependent oxidoreductase [Planctomycetes bacterium]|nr:NAD(P)-dependent oxidoreductase [Planctomycetota bacterium]